MIEDLDPMVEDLTPTITRKYVEGRVAEWKERLRALFAEIGEWAKDAGWQIDGSETVRMDEELMQKFGVSATDQPVLRLDRDGAYALFKPKGLWVIGANGRVDLYTSKGVYVIVDRADRDAPPQWTIFRASEKRDGDLFVPELISRLA